MFCKIKYLMTIFLLYELSNGEVIQECFGLNKNEGYGYFYYLSRESSVTVNISCNYRFIRLVDIVHSISKNYSNLCPSDGCSISQGDYICNCCKLRPYPTDECMKKYFFSDHDRQSCESRKQCKLTIPIEYIGTFCQLHYQCDKDLCKSRWVDVDYECISGRTTEYC